MADHVDTIIVLTTGKQDRGMRATLALSWACTVLAMSKSVALYMTMDGTVWATRGSADGVQVDGFEPLGEYFEQFFALGGTLCVCSPCSHYYCGQDRDQIEKTLVPQAKLCGLSTVVGMAAAHSQVITF